MVSSLVPQPGLGLTSTPGSKIPGPGVRGPGTPGVGAPGVASLPKRLSLNWFFAQPSELQNPSPCVAVMANEDLYTIASAVYCIGAEPPIQPIQDDSTDSAISVTQVNYRKTGVRLLSLSLSLCLGSSDISACYCV